MTDTVTLAMEVIGDKASGARTEVRATAELALYSNVLTAIPGG